MRRWRQRISGRTVTGLTRILGVQPVAERRAGRCRRAAASGNRNLPYAGNARPLSRPAACNLEIRRAEIELAALTGSDERRLGAWRQPGTSGQISRPWPPGWKPVRPQARSASEPAVPTTRSSRPASQHCGKPQRRGSSPWRRSCRRRLAPAMRTCQAIEDRQAMLSRKLARATTLVAHKG